jgi:hypothetical protein
MYPGQVQAWFLDTPIGVCKEGISFRTLNTWRERLLKAESLGNPSPVYKMPNFSNTEAKFRQMGRTRSILLEKGLCCVDVSRDNGVEKLREVFSK